MKRAITAYMLLTAVLLPIVLVLGGAVASSLHDGGSAMRGLTFAFIIGSVAVRRTIRRPDLGVFARLMSAVSAIIVSAVASLAAVLLLFFAISALTNVISGSLLGPGSAILLAGNLTIVAVLATLALHFVMTSKLSDRFANYRLSGIQKVPEG